MRTIRRGLPSSIVVGLFLTIAPAVRTSLISAASAAEPALDERLAAGEFAPALAEAQNETDRARRDALLEQTALAQRAAGASGASLATTSMISDDLRRQGVYDQIRREPPLALGGGVQPDFNSLIELLTSTIAPQTWNDVGGAGAVKQFTGGVSVDPQGMLRRMPKNSDASLRTLREQATANAASNAVGDPRRTAPLRKVSLTRLERALQRRLAAGAQPDDEMQLLAGLERVQYIFAYPETGELVIAGPAAAWQQDAEQRWVSAETGRPVLRLDDLVVLLRQLRTNGDGRFGCSIDPTQVGLERTQAFLDQSRGRALKPGERDRWLEQVRSTLGTQVISVFGIDPHTHAARVLVEADYRMKLVGIGLEPGTLDVPSYLDSIPAGQAPPSMSVLRWWFTMTDDALAADDTRLAFAVRGQGVQLQSENELLAAQGQRTQTGKSDELNREFAHRFTQHFAELAAKYPIYAELQNVFDLARVAALVQYELGDKIGWHQTCFGNAQELAVPYDAAPTSVDTVANSRLIRQVQIVAAVSGGVTADLRAAIKSVLPDRSGQADSQRHAAEQGSADERWWWD